MQDDRLDGLTLRQCEARLQESTLTLEERVRLLGRRGRLLFDQGEYEAAIASYEQALALKPDDADATYQRALSLDALGRYREALAGFDRAIALQPKAAQIWCDRGHAQIRGARQYKAAIASYDRAIALQPDLAEAWSGRGFALGLLGKFSAAVKSCQRAVDLEPDAARILSNMGAVLSLAKRNTEALGYFDRAIALEPEFNKTWNNRGIVFVSLHRYEEALTDFETSLTLPSPRHESWYPLAWLNHGLVLQRMGRHREAIASFEKSQLLSPTLLQTAVLKLFSLVMSGAFWGYATGASTRGLLLRDLGTILNSLKYVLLALVAFLWLSNAAQGPWAEAAKRAISLMFSAGIVTLMVVELWKRKSTLGFVWRVYFRSGFLTYIRAIAILTVTLITAVVLTLAVPPFMRLGWADLVFGQSGNVIFQPLQIAQDAPLPEAEAPETTDLPLTDPGAASPNPDSPSSDSPNTATPNPGSANSEDSNSENRDPDSLDPESLLNGENGDRQPSAPRSAWQRIDYPMVFIASFWLLLLLLFPFWANLEERIFRRGGNTWKQIGIRSVLFGMVHLLVGIPLVAGFVLIVPGFLFACRYKYVRDRHFRQHGDARLADEAGVLASTADHAVYNAILVTIFVVPMLVLRWLTLTGHGG